MFYFARKIISNRGREIKRNRAILAYGDSTVNLIRFVVIEASNRFLCERKRCRFIPPSAFDWTVSRDRVLLASVDNEKLHWKLRDIFESVVPYRKILRQLWGYYAQIGYKWIIKKKSQKRKSARESQISLWMQRAFCRVDKIIGKTQIRYPREGLEYFSIRTRGRAPRDKVLRKFVLYVCVRVYQSARSESRKSLPCWPFPMFNCSYAVSGLTRIRC